MDSHGVIPMTVLCVITNNHRGLALQLKGVIVDRCSHMNKRFRKLENPFPIKMDFKKNENQEQQDTWVCGICNRL